MAGMKSYMMDIENYVIEAFEKGARNEEDVVAYVRTQMQASELDVLVIAREFFEFVRYVAEDGREKLEDGKYWC